MPTSITVDLLHITLETARINIMYHIGYCEHYLDLRRRYPHFKFEYPRDWSLKEYGTLFIYDLIVSRKAKRVLEVGCGYDTFFSKEMARAGVEHWAVDKSNNYWGIGKDLSRFNAVMDERKRNGTKFIDELLGGNSTELPDDYFDIVFSMSVIEHIDDSIMPSVVNDMKRILKPEGLSAHSIDIYPRSKKAAFWHMSTKQAGFDVPLPYYDRWEFEGKYTTFIEQPKIRYIIYNSLSFEDPLADGAPYVSQFATMLCVASKPSQ